MTYSSIVNTNLGYLAQIGFSEGFRSQMSMAYPEWDMIYQKKVDDPNEREHRYLLHTDLGLGAIAEMNPNGSADFPAGVAAKIAEATAYYKEMAASIEYDLNLEEMLKKGNKKYAEQLELEMMSKLNGIKRVQASRFFADGTGVLGTAASVDDTNIATGSIVVTLDATDTTRGHAGLFLPGDHVLCKQAAGTARAPDGGTGANFAYYKVASRNFSTPSVTLSLVNSSDTVVANYAASNIAATDVFYRANQPTFSNLASISDYGTTSECILGLESLAASDGRTVNGIALTGVCAGTAYDAGGAVIDPEQVHALMDELKRNVGQDIYKWSQAQSAPEVMRALVAAGETDRRFGVGDDIKRGSKVWQFTHGNDVVSLQTSEFCPKTRFWILPEEKNGNKVLEFRGTDFYPVKVGKNEEFLKPSASTAGRYARKATMFLQGFGQLICKHPASIGRLHNFVLS